MSFILIALAAIFKAVADTIAHHPEVFPRTRFWNLDRSNAFPRYLPFTKWKIDGWHLSNSLMILSFVFAFVFNDSRMEWYWQVIVSGIVFNLTFNIFYGKIFR